MTYEIERLQNLDITDADLIFFPVLRHGHYFLICINIKASKVEIIDNKALVCGVTMKDKYGDCTTLLDTTLKEYLALGSSALFWKVDELTEEVVDINWKESENYIDCGLFVMRHKETYNGTLQKWNSGFRKKASLNVCRNNHKVACQHIEKHCDQENQTVVQQEMNSLYSNVNIQ
nr:uncharacterized protein LOC109158392 [Ipomoea batatas]